MASRKRTPAERQLDLHIVAAGMALGWSDTEIAGAINGDRGRPSREADETQAVKTQTLKTAENRSDKPQPRSPVSQAEPAGDSVAWAVGVGDPEAHIWSPPPRLARSSSGWASRCANRRCIPLGGRAAVGAHPRPDPPRARREKRALPTIHTREPYRKAKASFR